MRKSTAELHELTNQEKKRIIDNFEKEKKAAEDALENDRLGIYFLYYLCSFSCREIFSLFVLFILTN